MARPPTTGKKRSQPSVKASRRPAKPADVKALAAELKCSERTLYAYFADGCPRGDADAIRAWRAANVRDRQSYGDNADDVQDIGAAKLELIRKQTIREHELGKRYQIENAVRSGQLVERAAIERDLSLIFGRLRDRITSLGTECANIVPSELKASVKRVVDERMRLAMKELADGLDDFQGEGQ